VNYFWKVVRTVGLPHTGQLIGLHLTQ